MAKKDEKNKEGEDKVFGDTPETTSDKPQNEPQQAKDVKSEGGKVTISEVQFKSIMSRLDELENGVIERDHKSNNPDVFNPLLEKKEKDVCRVTYHGDDLVVGYKGKKRPDGKEIFVWNELHKDSNTVRSYVTLILENQETGELHEETVDYVMFLDASVQLEATITKRNDIGKVVEHGMVRQRGWDGKGFNETGQVVMSGSKEQQYVFTVEHKGKEYNLPQQVVNIK